MKSKKLAEISRLTNQLCQKCLFPNSEERVKKIRSFISSIKHFLLKRPLPEIFHYFKTSEKLAEWSIDSGLIEAALIHHATKDEIERLKLKKQFRDVEQHGFLLDNLNRDYKDLLEHLKQAQEIELREDRQLIGELRTKLFELHATLSQPLQNMRVIFLVAASCVDRLENWEKYKLHPGEVRARVTFATEILSPFAQFIARNDINSQLQDQALRVTKPTVFDRALRELLKKNRFKQLFENLEKQFKKELNKSQKGKSIKHIINIEFRLKSISSFVAKQDAKPEDEVKDLIAMRIIVDTDDISDCYYLKEICCSLWHQIPEQYYDYIANPKSNGYRALHLKFCECPAFKDKEQHVFEVQIRNMEMHEEAEMGSALHKKYKEEIPEPLPGEVVYCDDKAWTISSEWSYYWETLFNKNKVVLEDNGTIWILPLSATPIDIYIFKYKKLGPFTVEVKRNRYVYGLSPTKLKQPHDKPPQHLPANVYRHLLNGDVIRICKIKKSWDINPDILLYCAIPWVRLKIIKDLQKDKSLNLSQIIYDIGKRIFSKESRTQNLPPISLLHLHYKDIEQILEKEKQNIAPMLSQFQVVYDKHFLKQECLSLHNILKSDQKHLKENLRISNEHNFYSLFGLMGHAFAREVISIIKQTLIEEARWTITGSTAFHNFFEQRVPHEKLLRRAINETLSSSSRHKYTKTGIHNIFSFSDIYHYFRYIGSISNIERTEAIRKAYKDIKSVKTKELKKHFNPKEIKDWYNNNKIHDRERYRRLDCVPSDLGLAKDIPYVKHVGYPSCCFPLPGERIVAEIREDSKTKSIILIPHVEKCNKLELITKCGNPPEKVSWDSMPEKAYLPFVRLRIAAVDRLGLVNAITSRIIRKNFNMAGIRSKIIGVTAQVKINVYLRSLSQLHDLIHDIAKNVPEVFYIDRANCTSGCKIVFHESNE